MTELPPDPDDLFSKVEHWLEGQGFPFELEVGSQLRAAGMHDLEHGHFYRDSRTGKWREIDILATRFVLPDSRPTRTQPPVVKVRFVAECKHAKKPWVALTSESSPTERRFPSGFLLGRVASALVERAELIGGDGVSLGAFGVAKTRGHGVVESLGSQVGRRRAYAALRSVVAAAGAEAHDIDESLTTGERPPNPPLNVLFLVLPVIVMRGRLFQLSSGAAGMNRLREVDEVAVFAPGPEGSRRSSTLVRIVKPGEPLARLVERATADAAVIGDLLRPNWTEHVARASRTFGLNIMSREQATAALMYATGSKTAAGDNREGTSRAL